MPATTRLLVNECPLPAFDAVRTVQVVLHTVAPVATAADWVVSDIGRRLPTNCKKSVTDLCDRVLAVLAPVDLRGSLAILQAGFCAASQTSVPTSEQLSSGVLPVVLQAPARTVVTPSPHPPA